MGSEEKNSQSFTKNSSSLVIHSRKNKQNRDANHQRFYSGECHRSWLDQIDPLDLPFVRLNDRKSLPNIMAVYFVITGEGQILYIGKAVRLVLRWLGHHRYEEFKPYRDVLIAWVQVEAKSDLESIEVFFTKKFSPKLDKSGNFGNKKNASEPRTELITVRISQQEKERFAKLAISKDKPLAELIRYLLERECERS